MRAYISVSYSKRKALAPVIAAIKMSLQREGIEPFVFCDQYCFDPSEEKQMMQQAIKDITSSDLLIAETSDKAIGIGIEAGYAKALGKPVIYIRNESAEHSTTLGGISDHLLIYHDDTDVKEKLSKLMDLIRPGVE